MKLRTSEICALPSHGTVDTVLLHVVLAHCRKTNLEITVGALVTADWLRAANLPSISRLLLAFDGATVSSFVCVFQFSAAVLTLSLWFRNRFKVIVRILLVLLVLNLSVIISGNMLQM